MPERRESESDVGDGKWEMVETEEMIGGHTFTDMEREGEKRERERARKADNRWGSPAQPKQVWRDGRLDRGTSTKKSKKKKVPSDSRASHGRIID